MSSDVGSGNDQSGGRGRTQSFLQKLAASVALPSGSVGHGAGSASPATDVVAGVAVPAPQTEVKRTVLVLAIGDFVNPTCRSDMLTLKSAVKRLADEAAKLVLLQRAVTVCMQADVLGCLYGAHDRTVAMTEIEVRAEAFTISARDLAIIHVNDYITSQPGQAALDMICLFDLSKFPAEQRLLAYLDSDACGSLLSRVRDKFEADDKHWVDDAMALMKCLLWLKDYRELKEAADREEAAARETAAAPAGVAAGSEVVWKPVADAVVSDLSSGNGKGLGGDAAGVVGASDDVDLLGMGAGAAVGGAAASLADTATVKMDLCGAGSVCAGAAESGFSFMTASAPAATGAEVDIFGGSGGHGAAASAASAEADTPVTTDMTRAPVGGLSRLFSVRPGEGGALAAPSEDAATLTAVSDTAAPEMHYMTFKTEDARKKALTFKVLTPLCIAHAKAGDNCLAVTAFAPGTASSIGGFKTTLCDLIDAPGKWAFEASGDDEAVHAMELTTSCCKWKVSYVFHPSKDPFDSTPKCRYVEVKNIEAGNVYRFAHADGAYVTSAFTDSAPDAETGTPNLL